MKPTYVIRYQVGNGWYRYPGNQPSRTAAIEQINQLKRDPSKLTGSTKPKRYEVTLRSGMNDEEVVYETGG